MLLHPAMPHPFKIYTRTVGAVPSLPCPTHSKSTQGQWVQFLLCHVPPIQNLHKDSGCSSFSAMSHPFKILLCHVPPIQNPLPCPTHSKSARGQWVQFLLCHVPPIQNLHEDSGCSSFSAMSHPFKIYTRTVGAVPSLPCPTHSKSFSAMSHPFKILLCHVPPIQNLHEDSGCSSFSAMSHPFKILLCHFPPVKNLHTYIGCNSFSASFCHSSQV